MNRCPQCWKLFAPPVDAYPQHVGCIPLPPHATAYIVELLTEIATLKGTVTTATTAMLAYRSAAGIALNALGLISEVESSGLAASYEQSIRSKMLFAQECARALTDGETPQ